MTASVAFVQRRIPHYREAFFAGLHDDLGRRGVALDILVGNPDTATANAGGETVPSVTAIPSRRLTAFGRDVIWQDVLGATRRHDLVVVEFALRIVSNLALVARSRVTGPSIAGFGHGPDFSKAKADGPGSPRARLIRSADWWFAYNDLSRDAVVALGFPEQRITAINNTIDSQPLSDAVAGHRRAGIDELRRGLGIAGGPVAVFCGTLHARKRLGFVLDAALRLRERFPALHLLIVGDGPDAGEARRFAEEHDWVRYAGRVVGLERAPYLAAADVMMMPGLVGLVIIDAFAARVPLVTTDWPFHSPEIQYLDHGVNGWRSPNTLAGYVNAVTRVLDDAGLRARLRRGCAESAAAYPLGAMVSRFSEGIVTALGQCRRPRAGLRAIW